MPSTTQPSFRSRAKLMIAPTMLLLVASLVMLEVNDRSIFTALTGSVARYRRLAKPVPKSSMAIPTPSVRNFAELTQDRRAGIEQHGLGELENEVPRSHAMPLEGCFHCRTNVDVLSLSGTEIHGHRDGLVGRGGRRVLGSPPREGAESVVEHALTQIGNEPRILGHRDESVG